MRPFETKVREGRRDTESAVAVFKGPLVVDLVGQGWADGSRKRQQQIPGTSACAHCTQLDIQHFVSHLRTKSRCPNSTYII